MVRAAQGFKKIGNLLPKQESGQSALSEKTESNGRSTSIKITGSQNLGREQSKLVGKELSEAGYKTKSNGTTSLPSVDTNPVEVKRILSEAAAQGKTGVLVCAMPWIKDWQPSNINLPVPREAIEAENVRLSILNRPCPLDMGIAIMESTLELYGKPDNWDLTAEFYLEAIEDLPMDVLIDTMRSVRMNCKWFPKVSEIRDYIDKTHWLRKSGELMTRVMLRKVGATYAA